MWREKNCVALLADVALSSTLITQKWVFAIWGLCWYNVFFDMQSFNSKRLILLFRMASVLSENRTSCSTKKRQVSPKFVADFLKIYSFAPIGCSNSRSWINQQISGTLWVVRQSIFWGNVFDRCTSAVQTLHGNTFRRAVSTMQQHML